MKNNHTSTLNKRRPFIKVCGLTYAGSVDCAAAYGADYVGFNFCRGNARYVSPAHAASMPTAQVKRVGVFNSGDVLEICRAMKQAGLHLAELQGTCSLETARRIGRQRVIRTLVPGHGCTPQQLQREVDIWASSCCAFLVECADAPLLSAVEFPLPWILSGGPETAVLLKKLGACRPDGVNIESRVGCPETMAAMRAVC